MENEQISTTTTPPTKRQLPVLLIVFAALVLLVAGELVFRSLKNRGWMVYTTDNSELPDNYITALQMDPQGDLWIATEAFGEGGLAVLRANGSWATYTTRNSGLPSNDVSALAYDNHSQLWVATTQQCCSPCNQGGLSKLSPEGDWTTYTPDNSALPDRCVNTVTTDSQGRVWVGTDGGLTVILPDGSWSTFTTSNSPLAGDFVREIVVDGEGKVWIAGFWGLSVLAPDGESMTTICKNEAGKYCEVHDIAVDREDRPWVALGVGWGDGGLRTLAPDGSWTIYTAANSKLTGDYVNAIAVDGNGRVWLAGSVEDGLTAISPNGDWTTYTSANSGWGTVRQPRLRAFTVNAFATDQHGRVWVGTSEGLMAFDRKEAFPTPVLGFLASLRTVVLRIGLPGLALYTFVWSMREIRRQKPETSRRELSAARLLRWGFGGAFVGFGLGLAIALLLFLGSLASSNPNIEAQPIFLLMIFLRCPYLPIGYLAGAFGGGVLGGIIDFLVHGKAGTVGAIIGGIVGAPGVTVLSVLAGLCM